MSESVALWRRLRLPYSQSVKPYKLYSAQPRAAGQGSSRTRLSPSFVAPLGDSRAPSALTRLSEDAVMQLSSAALELLGSTVSSHLRRCLKRARALAITLFPAGA